MLGLQLRAFVINATSFRVAQRFREEATALRTSALWSGSRLHDCLPYM
jgi:hypothetical protein